MKLQKADGSPFILYTELVRLPDFFRLIVLAGAGCWWFYFFVIAGINLLLSIGSDKQSTAILLQWLVLALVFGVALPWYFHSHQLQITVSRSSLIVERRPFQSIPLEIPLDCIKNWETRRISLFRISFGGGYAGPEIDKVYTVSRATGVLLQLTNGENIFIGSGDSITLQTAIAQAKDSAKPEDSGAAVPE